MWSRRQVIAGVMCLGSFPPTSTMRSDLSQLPDIRDWPSLLDVLPARIQADVRAGRYQGDLSAAMREAVETGLDFTIPAGIYPIAGGMIEMRKPGQRIVGTGGLLRRLPLRDGVGLLVSAADVVIYNLRMDGTAAAVENNQTNDMVRVVGDGCTLVDLLVHGAWGSNLRLDGVRNCHVVRPVLTDAYQNNLLICNAPTQDIRIDNPICHRTVTQNNIFVTASDASTNNGHSIFRVTINNPLCTDAGDTAIELGYHSFDCTVEGGRVVNSYHPGLLQRDGRRNRWIGTIVENKKLSEQHGDYDGVAVVPQWEAPSWDSDSEFNGIVVKGQSRRAAYYWGQSGIRRIDCVADAFALGDGPVRAGPDRIGSGDMKAGAVSRILFRGGAVRGYAIGDNWNYDSRPYDRADCLTDGVVFEQCAQIINCYNIAPKHSAIINNTGKDNIANEIMLLAARLWPSDDNPNVGLTYYNNSFSEASGRHRLMILLPPGAPPVEGLLLSRNSRFVRIAPDRPTVVDIGDAAGLYSIYAETTRIDFTLAASAGRISLLGSPKVSGSGRNDFHIAVENGKLVLHPQNGARWIHISGPGIRGIANAGTT